MNTAHTRPECPHCGLHHKATCHRIRAIEYHPNGTLKRVEFHDTWAKRALQRDPGNVALVNED